MTYGCNPSGFGCDQNMWRFVTPAFEKEYRIILFDYVGSGKSVLEAYNRDRYSDLEGYAQDLLEICENLKLEKVLFVGHSVSSMIGIILAVKSPDLFSKLILIGPSPRYVNDENYFGGFSKLDLEGLFEVMDNNYLGWANFLAPVVMKNPEMPDLTLELKESFCSTDPYIARRFAEVTFFSDNRNDLSKVKIPCLILQCSEDDIAPDAVGKYVSDNIPNSTFVKMQATGHCPHMSHPEETIMQIMKFI